MFNHFADLFQVAGEMEELDRVRENQRDRLGLREAVANLRHPDIHRPVALISTNFLLVTCTGAPAITYYAVQVG